MFKIIVFLIILFLGVFNVLLSQENVKWKLDDNHIFKDENVDIQFSYSSPIIASEESPNGISQFQDIISLSLTYNTKISQNNYWGIGINFERLMFSEDYYQLINSPNNNPIFSLGIKSNYNFTLIKGKNLSLNLNNSFGVAYLVGENLKQSNNNGYDFSSLGLSISSGTNLNIPITNVLDINFGAELSFSYIGQLLFFPKFNVSLTKWIN